MPYSQDFVPSTIKEAVDHIVAHLDENELTTIRGNPDSGCVHFFGGMAMRNNWSLWEKETPLKRDAIETYRIAMADDLSGLIMAWVWAIVRGEDFDPFQHVARYHEHWKRYGTTSLGAGGYNEDGTPMDREGERRHAEEARQRAQQPEPEVKLGFWAWLWRMLCGDKWMAHPDPAGSRWWGIYHPWRKHSWGYNLTREEAVHTADHLNWHRQK